MKRLLLAAGLAGMVLGLVPARAATGPDVAVTMTTTTPSVAPGDSVSYTIVVTAGDADVSDVTVLAPVPETIPIWSVEGDIGTWSGDPGEEEYDGTCVPQPPGPGDEIVIGGGSILKCGYGTIAASTSKTLTLSAVAGTDACPGLFPDAIAVSSSDSDPANNAASHSADDDPFIAVVCPADVAVDVGGADIRAGGRAQFTLTVTPSGSEDPTSVVVTAALPAGLTWTKTDNGDGASSACTIASGSITCNFGTMARPDRTEDVRTELAVGDPIAPAVKVVLIRAMTTFADCAGLSLTATATSGNDGDASNDSDTHAIAVDCEIAMEQADSINHVTDLEYAFVTCPLANATATAPAAARQGHVPKTQGVNGVIALIGGSAGGTVTITPTGPHADETLLAAVFYDATCARIPGAGLVAGAGDVVTGPIPAMATAISVLYVEGPAQGVDSHGELHGVGTATMKFTGP